MFNNLFKLVVLSLAFAAVIVLSIKINRNMSIMRVESFTCMEIRKTDSHNSGDKFIDGPHGLTSNILNFVEIMPKEHTRKILNNGYLSYGDVFYICDFIKKEVGDWQEMSRQEKLSEQSDQIKRIKNET
jgi:hypothetical protein